MATEDFSNEVEEGELLEADTEELYIPLERPHVPVQNHEVLPKPSESDDESLLKHSSSDSDSSNGETSSKFRKSNLPKAIKTVPVKKKKYNIWCSSDLQADALTDSLLNCDVSQERDRNVESYHYRGALKDRVIKTARRKNHNWEQAFHHKRKHNGDFSETYQKSKNCDSIEPEAKGNSKNILSLSTTVENTESEIATDIANKLYEKKEDLILRAVNILGKKTVISLFEETREVEASGGLLIMNGSRRRTPGGVFFYLLRISADIPRDKIKLVFSDDKKTSTESRRREAKKLSKLKAAKFKEALLKEDFPTLLTRAELAIKQYKEKHSSNTSAETSCSDSEGKNSKTTSEIERLIAYDDELFGSGQELMDSF